MIKCFGDKVIEFNSNLIYAGKLPSDFQVINPCLDNPETMEVMRQFYHKYYHDSSKRKFIVGINPSRHGVGVTGIPFTDTKRLESECGIKMHSAYTHEVSSVFMYEMIVQFGGASAFYEQFYINSPFPLAIVRKAKGGNWLNANYYDNAVLFEMLKDYMIMTLKAHIDMGLDTSEVFVLGVKNAQFIHKFNDEAKLFGGIKILEHPRYIQQYKFKEKQIYIDKYILTLNNLL